eukprot:gene13262-4095_t
MGSYDALASLSTDAISELPWWCENGQLRCPSVSFYGRNQRTTLVHGFCSKRSCVTQLLEFTSDVIKNMKDRKQTDALIGEVLKHVDSAKYLGVEISSEMKWDTHINNTENKENRTLGFLTRNIRQYSQNLKSKAYKVIIKPTLEYASAIWDPYTKKHINAIDMTQRRAARYVTNRYERYASLIEMLRELRWDSLEERRRRQRLVIQFKTI